MKGPGLSEAAKTACWLMTNVRGVIVEDFGAVGEEPAAGQGVFQAEFALQRVDCRPDVLQR